MQSSWLGQPGPQEKVINLPIDFAPIRRKFTENGTEIPINVALEQIKTLQMDLQVIQKELEEKYGQVTVNLTDGTISEIPKENESDKED